MKQLNKKKTLFSLGLVAAFAFNPLVSTRVNAASFDLCAGETQITMPDGVTVTMWGFASGGIDAVTGLCANAPQVPGPELNAGVDNSLTVNLVNTLNVPVSLIIPGQNDTTLTPVFNDPTATGRARRVRSLNHEAAANGGSASYQWSSLKPGSHIYHSATHQQAQVPMGLYGAMVKNTAVGEAYVGHSYAQELILFYSEIDPVLNAAIAAGCFGAPENNNCAPENKISSALHYRAQYFLVNGMPSDGSVPVDAGETGQNILLRLFNAGLKTHVPQILGTRFQQLAENGYPYSYAKSAYTIQLPALATADAIINSADAGFYSLYDRRLNLSDGSAGRGMITKLAISAGAAAPTAVNDSAITDEDVAVNVDVLANDIAQAPATFDPATVTLNTTPVHGQAAVNADGSITYSADANYHGSDQFSYSVSDSNGKLSNTATVSMTVNAVNDAPVATADTVNVIEGSSAQVVDVLANDSDVDGDNISIASIDLTGTVGTVVDNGVSISYTPQAGALVGSTDSFSYVITDGQAISASVSVTVTITAAQPPINGAPVAIDDFALTSKNTDVVIDILQNDSDDGGLDVNSVVLTGTAIKGSSVTYNGDGTVTFRPKRHFTGTDVFQYTVQDNLGLISNTASVRVNVVK